METLSVHQQSVDCHSTDSLDFIETEVDMGFFGNHYFVEKDGIIVNNGCQRISHCSCDCNHCSWGLL